VQCRGLDIHTSKKTWDQFYAVDPMAGLTTTTQKAHMIGGEACVWTVTFDASMLPVALWPRLLAVSERLWSPAAKTTNASSPQTQALSRLTWARCVLNSRGIGAGSVLANEVPDPAPLYGSCLLQ
jgi:hexosaminidase